MSQLTEQELERMNHLEAEAEGVKRDIKSEELKMEQAKQMVESLNDYLKELNEEYRPLLQRYDGE